MTDLLYYNDDASISATFSEGMFAPNEACGVSASLAAYDSTEDYP